MPTHMSELLLFELQNQILAQGRSAAFRDEPNDASQSQQHSVDGGEAELRHGAMRS